MILYMLLVGLCCSASMAGNSASTSNAFGVSVSAVQQASGSQQAASKKERRKKIKPKNERTPAAAAVTSKRNITRASISQRSTDGHYAELVIMDGGINIRNPQDLQMIGSSGNQIATGSHIMFENFVVPFEGRVRFKSPNKMNTVIYDREISFKINEPGRWIVRVEI